MNKEKYLHRMYKIVREELKSAMELNTKLLKEFIRAKETNRQLLLYIDFLEQKILDLQKED